MIKKSDSIQGLAVDWVPGQSWVTFIPWLDNFSVPSVSVEGVSPSTIERDINRLKIDEKPNDPPITEPSTHASNPRKLPFTEPPASSTRVSSTSSSPSGWIQCIVSTAVIRLLRLICRIGIFQVCYVVYIVNIDNDQPSYPPPSSHRVPRTSWTWTTSPP